jgi:AraC-like DNA-binding protein
MKEMDSLLNLKDNNEEIVPIDSAEYPFVCIYRYLDRCIGSIIPWHWHSFLELSYVAEGELIYQTPDETFTLKKGDAMFINSDTLHFIRPAGQAKDCCIVAFLFDMHFLSGMYSSLFEQNYLRPVMNCRSLQMYPIHPDSRRRLEMLDSILKVRDLDKAGGFGSEFEVRHELSRFWCMLMEETEEIRREDRKLPDTDSQRIKDMMHFIEEHYGDKITIDDIAKSAGISERECRRCFGSCMNLSPVDYLNKFRIRKSAERLLKTGDSVLDIGLDCGFSSNSYFGKTFREEMGCTPKEYRKNSGGSPMSAYYHENLNP